MQSWSHFIPQIWQWIVPSYEIIQSTTPNTIMYLYKSWLFSWLIANIYLEGNIPTIYLHPNEYNWNSVQTWRSVLHVTNLWQEHSHLYQSPMILTGLPITPVLNNDRVWHLPDQVNLGTRDIFRVVSKSSRNPKKFNIGLQKKQ